MPHPLLSNYTNESPALRLNLARVLSHGCLAHTGKILIQAVDQGFEHGPWRSYGQNLDAMDPSYHFHMACDGGLSAYAAPLGWLSASVDTFINQVPMILKLNSSNALYASSHEPDQSVTASVKDAVRLGCVGVGFTLYPGSGSNLDLMREAQSVIEEARSFGLFTVLWSYARGGDLSKEDETALDVVAYGAHMACLLGAHIVKVKLPSARIALKEHKDIYANIPTSTQHERVSHVVKSCFDGKRIVIFSGGAKKGDEALLQDMSDICQGGGHGAIIGRNIFQRPKEDAIHILSQMTNTLKNS